MKYLLISLFLIGCTSEERPVDCGGNEDEIAKQVLICAAGKSNQYDYDTTIRVCYETMREIYCKAILKRGK